MREIDVQSNGTAEHREIERERETMEKKRRKKSLASNSLVRQMDEGESTHKEL